MIMIGFTYFGKKISINADEIIAFGEDPDNPERSWIHTSNEKKYIVECTYQRIQQLLGNMVVWV